MSVFVYSLIGSVFLETNNITKEEAFKLGLEVCTDFRVEKMLKGEVKRHEKLGLPKNTGYAVMAILGGLKSRVLYILCFRNTVESIAIPVCTNTESMHLLGWQIWFLYIHKK